jgi:protein-tyrosine phosphatase
MAEGLFADRLAEAGVDAQVSSAGLLRGGAPATEHATATLQRRGIDISGHRSRQLAAEMISGADLVIGMTREHVREAVVLVPDAFPRSFTLKELVGLGERTGARRRGEDLQAWLQRVGEGRRTSDLLGASEDPALDVADPIGGPRSGYERTAAELDALIERLAGLIWYHDETTGERSA